MLDKNLGRNFALWQKGRANKVACLLVQVAGTDVFHLLEMKMTWAMPKNEMLHLTATQCCYRTSTSAAEELNQELPETNLAGSQSGTWHELEIP